MQAESWQEYPRYLGNPRLVLLSRAPSTGSDGCPQILYVSIHVSIAFLLAFALGVLS
jgi:hypothetical protein